MQKEDFFTFSEYMKRSPNPLTASMEDYLEMIYRLSQNIGFTRINDLAAALNVQPPSATKMVQRLSDLNLAQYEKYGVILLTEEGNIMGNMLLNRHELLEKFLSFLGVKDSLLEETEKIEHSINEETLCCISNFLKFIESNPQIESKFNSSNKSP